VNLIWEKLVWGKWKLRKDCRLEIYREFVVRFREVLLDVEKVTEEGVAVIARGIDFCSDDYVFTSNFSYRSLSFFNFTTLNSKFTIKNQLSINFTT
jgi:hypothetical protein